MTETHAAATETTNESSSSAVNLPTDSPSLRKAIKAAGAKVASLRADRTEINAAIQEALESVAAKGIPKDALKRAIVDAALDEDVREAQDIAYCIARAALGKPVQADLFPADGVKH